MFHPEDLDSIDVQDYVRREQQRFFRGGAYDPREAASQIALEALLSGASDTRIIYGEGWITVYSDIDWLGDSTESAFTHLKPFTPGGPNAVTTEIFLTVFSRAVVTATPSGVYVIKGESLGPLGTAPPSKGRAVAFETASA